MRTDEIEARWAEAIAKAGVATEAEMRDVADPWPKTAKELAEYIARLIDRPHDYETCCYAMSLAALAAFNYLGSALGVTGFQASCADLDFLRRTRGMKHGFMILDAENLLYPQYDLVARVQEFIKEHRIALAPVAQERLAKSDADFTHPDVRRHWEELAALARPSTTKGTP